MDAPKYEIITELKICDMTGKEPDDFNNKVFEEQLQKLKDLGYEFYCKEYPIHFFDTIFHNEVEKEYFTLNEATQCLAIKEGADLVKYENGNIGYVSYYNSHRDGFEILKGEEK